MCICVNLCIVHSRAPNYSTLSKASAKSLIASLKSRSAREQDVRRVSVSGAVQGSVEQLYSYSKEPINRPLLLRLQEKEDLKHAAVLSFSGICPFCLFIVFRVLALFVFFVAFRVLVLLGFLCFFSFLLLALFCFLGTLRFLFFFAFQVLAPFAFQGCSSSFLFIFHIPSLPSFSLPRCALFLLFYKRVEKEHASSLSAFWRFGFLDLGDFTFSPYLRTKCCDIENNYVLFFNYFPNFFGIKVKLVNFSS